MSIMDSHYKNFCAAVPACAKKPSFMKRLFTFSVSMVTVVILSAAPLTAAASSASVENVMLPNNLLLHTRLICYEYDVDTALVLSLMYNESRFYTGAYNSSCVGLMQIQLGLTKWLRQELAMDTLNLRNPEENIIAGVYILASYIETYENIHAALIAYNCGDTRAKQIMAQGTSSTTYSRNVVNRMAAFEQYRWDVPPPVFLKADIYRLAQ